MERRRRLILFVCVPYAGRCAFGAPSRRLKPRAALLLGPFGLPPCRPFLSQLLARGHSAAERSPGAPGAVFARHRQQAPHPAPLRRRLARAPSNEQDATNIKPPKRAGKNKIRALKSLQKFFASGEIAWTGPITPLWPGLTRPSRNIDSGLDHRVTALCAGPVMRVAYAAASWRIGFSFGCKWASCFLRN